MPPSLRKGKEPRTCKKLRKVQRGGWTASQGSKKKGELGNIKRGATLNVPDIL